MDKAVFDIRKLIEALRGTKDRLVERLDGLSSIDRTRCTLARNDFREAYNCLVVAWQLLNGATGEEDKDACRKFLGGSKSQLAQSMSQVAGFEDAVLGKLAAEFETQAGEVRAALEPFIAQPGKTKDPNARSVVKQGRRQYEVICSVCGEASMTFQEGTDVTGGEVVNFAGVASSRYIKLAEADRVFGLLDAMDFPTLHEIMLEEYDFDGGLDGYCPTCDKIYCRTHYNVREYWDEGYYDYAMGTCPAGHERELDD